MPNFTLFIYCIVSDMRAGATFRRSFVWFHHIYSKKKQQAIFRWSGELNLTGKWALQLTPEGNWDQIGWLGCMRTGKPGVVLVEGETEKVNRFVVQIKALNWQKMTVNATEDYTQPHSSGMPLCPSTKYRHHNQQNEQTFPRMTG